MKKGLKALFVLLMMLCFVGCELKPKNPKPTPVVVEEEKVLKISGETRELMFFNEILSMSLSFSKEEKVSSYNIVTGIVDEEGKVTVRFAKSNVQKDANEEEKYDARNIELKEKALGVEVSYDQNSNEAYVYVLTEDNKLYASTLTVESEIKTIRYDVSNIDGIASMNGNLEEGGTDAHPMIFIKTTDGKYYTDYPFSGDNGRVLREVKAKTEQ